MITNKGAVPAGAAGCPECIVLPIGGPRLQVPRSVEVRLRELPEVHRGAT